MKRSLHVSCWALPFLFLFYFSPREVTHMDDLIKDQRYVTSYTGIYTHTRGPSRSTEGPSRSSPTPPRICEDGTISAVPRPAEVWFGATLCRNL